MNRDLQWRKRAEKKKLRGIHTHERREMLSSVPGLMSQIRQK